MRKALDGLYEASGWIAALALFLIGALTLSQIAARFFDAIVPSADDFAGFAMAASSFMGLAYTLRRGGHIRVMLVLDRLRPPARRAAEALCLASATALIGFVGWHAWALLARTYRFNEWTLGLVPVPKWMPMTFMVAGIAILAVAYLDDLVQVLRGRPPSYARAAGADDARRGGVE